MKCFFSLSAVTVALLSSLLLVVSSSAQTREVRSIKCGANIVSVGAIPAELLQKCGEPDQKDRVEARLSHSGKMDLQLWNRKIHESHHHKRRKGRQD
jgi:hypothetical protein